MKISIVLLIQSLEGISIAFAIRSVDLALERGDWTHYDSIDIALRWSAGIWTCRVLSVDLSIVLLIRAWSAEIGRITILLTLRSAGARESGHVAFYQHFDPLDRGKGLRLESVTC